MLDTILYNISLIVYTVGILLINECQIQLHEMTDLFFYKVVLNRNVFGSIIVIILSLAIERMFLD
jgi:hypothetical protein